MKKVIPNGSAIKESRSQLERLSTQKEMAHEIGVSERTLRQIENANAPILVSTLDRLAKALGVHREQLILGMGARESKGHSLEDLLGPDEDQLIPRHDYDLAQATSDEGRLFDQALRSRDVACVIQTGLTEETNEYAQELFDILGGLSYSQRSVLDDIPPAEELALRRRIKQLMVLLKGNDIWIYETSVIRRLPERYTVAPPDEPCTHASRLVVALGPPGEYGETSIRVPIDHGQPFVLPSWKNLRAKLDAETVGGT